MSCEYQPSFAIGCDEAARPPGRGSAARTPSPRLPGVAPGRRRPLGVRWCAGTRRTSARVHAQHRIEPVLARARAPARGRRARSRRGCARPVPEPRVREPGVPPSSTAPCGTCARCASEATVSTVRAYTASPLSPRRLRGHGLLGGQLLARDAAATISRPGRRSTARSTVDVAILGAGYTGLWTAHSLLERDPSLRILIVEREIAGFGASGRNGAWCTFGFGAGPDLLTHHYGRDAARAVHDAMVAHRRRGRRGSRGRGHRRALREGRRALARRSASTSCPSLDARAAQLRPPRVSPSSRTGSIAQAAAEKLAVAGVEGGDLVPRDRGGAPRPPRARARPRRSSARARRSSSRPRSRTCAPARSPRSRPTRGIVNAGVVVLAGESYLVGASRLPARGAADLLADRAHRAAHRRAARRDQLDAPRGRALAGPHRRLSLAHQGRAGALRRARRAVPLRFRDPSRVRPARGDARSAARGRSSSGSRRSRACGPRTRGAAPSACPATGSRTWRYDRASPVSRPRTGTRARVSRRPTSVAGCSPTSSPGHDIRAHPPADGESPLAAVGARAVALPCRPLPAACVAEGRRAGRRAPARRPPAARSPNASSATDRGAAPN